MRRLDPNMRHASSAARFNAVSTTIRLLGGASCVKLEIAVAHQSWFEPSPQSRARQTVFGPEGLVGAKMVLSDVVADGRALKRKRLMVIGDDGDE